MGLSPTVLLLAAALPQTPSPQGRDTATAAPAAAAAAPALPKLPTTLHPEVVLADADDPVPLAQFGLGDGGLDAARKPGLLAWTDDGDCVTPGGIRVACRSVGVKLTFPSGRELLVAADGFVHLRSDERCGPFDDGLELRLGDGTCVRIRLSQPTRERLRDVTVVTAERSLQPWQRGVAVRELGRDGFWAGIRVACCGDGGDLYRAIAMGPLIVLDRILVEAKREAQAPTERLVVLTAPLVQSMATMSRQHREPDAQVRHAVGAVAALVDHREQLFPAGASLRRVEQNALRWDLRGGYELELALDGPLAPRLALFAGDAPRPMIEWTLGSAGAAYLANPRDDQIAKRWHGNGTRLPRVAVELQARAELFEMPYAMRVIDRLKARTERRRS